MDYQARDQLQIGRNQDRSWATKPYPHCMLTFFFSIHYRMEWAEFLLVVVALTQGGEAGPTSRGGVEKAPTFPAWDKAECQTQAWLRNLSKYQRRYACWEHILGEAVEEVTPHRNQLGYKDENPPVPCLTKRGRQLCRTLCGRQLLELVQDRNPRYGHPWVASCVRTHLVNRCGPEGIHCWLPEGRTRIQAKLEKQTDNQTVLIHHL